MLKTVKQLGKNYIIILYCPKPNLFESLIVRFYIEVRFPYEHS